MLPAGTVPASLLAVLEIFRACLTAPSFATFTALVTGTAAQTGRRTVTGILTGVGLSRVWPHDRVHYLFSRARWDVDQVGLAVARLIVAHLVEEGAPILVSVDDTLFKRYGKKALAAAVVAAFVPDGAAVTVAVDDTLFHRVGRKVFGVRWQHDGSARGRDGLGRGNCFVVVCLVVTVPSMARSAPVPRDLWIL